MPVPISHKLSLFATPLMLAQTAGNDFNLCIVGDSKSCDNSTGANLPFGIAAAWPHTNWSGFSRNGVANDGSIDKYMFDPGYTVASAPTNRVPGATFSQNDGANPHVGIFPCNSCDYKFPDTANAADNLILVRDELLGEYTFTVTTGGGPWTLATQGVSAAVSAGVSHYLYNGIPINVDMTGVTGGPPAGNYAALTGIVTGAGGLNDFGIIAPTATLQTAGTSTVSVPSRWASGDWWSNVALSARVIFYRDTFVSGTPATNGGMVGQLRLWTRRNRGAVFGTGTQMLPSAAVGVSYVDTAFQTATGYPGIQVRTETGYDEGVGATKRTAYYHGGFAWYRGTPGVRTPGLFVSSIAYSGGNTTHLLGALGGGGGSVAVPQANAVGWLQGMFSPRYWLVDLGQNATSAESTEYATGGYSVYKANIQLIINQIRVLHAAMSLSGLPVILLCAPYEAPSGTSGYGTLRESALYELSQENDSVAFLNVHRLMSSHLSRAIWTVDGTHPTPMGAMWWAATIWSACAANNALAEGPNEGSTGSSVFNEEIRKMGA